jgi:uncharacterized protein YkwD
MYILELIFMVRPLFAGLALSTLALAGSASGCDSVSSADKVIPQAETTAAAPASKKLRTRLFENSLEQSIHEQVNQYRQSRNLPPLTLDARISQQARAHSQAMASSGDLSHDGFEQRVKAIAREIPYRASAENVAFNQGYSNPGEQAVEGWINSPGHQKNMVGNYDLTGIGVAKNAKGEYYFTQIFIRRR